MPIQMESSEACFFTGNGAGNQDKLPGSRSRYHQQPQGGKTEYEGIFRVRGNYQRDQARDKPLQRRNKHSRTELVAAV